MAKKKSGKKTKSNKTTSRKNSDEEFGFLEKISFSDATELGESSLLGVFGYACNSHCLPFDPYGGVGSFIACDPRSN